MGTDIVHAIPLTLVAGTGHMMMGNFDLALLATLLMGSIPGHHHRLAGNARAPETLLRRLISSALVAVGIKMLVS